MSPSYNSSCPGVVGTPTHPKKSEILLIGQYAPRRLKPGQSAPIPINPLEEATLARQHLNNQEVSTPMCES